MVPIVSEFYGECPEQNKFEWRDTRPMMARYPSCYDVMLIFCLKKMVYVFCKCCLAFVTPVGNVLRINPRVVAGTGPVNIGTERK